MKRRYTGCPERGEEDAGRHLCPVTHGAEREMELQWVCETCGHREAIDEHADVADETFDELNARWYREDPRIVALVAAAREGLDFWDDEDGDNLREWRGQMSVALAPFEHREVT